MHEADRSHPEPSTSSAEIERRAWVRYESSLEVWTRTSGSMKDAGWPAKVANISAGGLGLLLRHRFGPGTPLTVELQDKAGTSRRTLHVEVVHAAAVVAQSDPCWLIGCAFATPLSADDLQALLQ